MNRRIVNRLARAGWALLILTSMLIGGARADPVADFYAKRQVTILAGTATGGTYDLYARTIARHIGKYIPGSPKVVVQNVPGAGGYLGAMRVLGVGPHDGTIIGAMGSSALPFQPLLDPNSPKFDPLNINWLGSTAGYNVLMLVRSDVPVYSVDDLRKRETVMATIAAGQFNSVVVAASNAALGTRIKGVRGHKGMNPAMLALESGEVEGYPTAPVDALKRLYSKQIADGTFRLLLQFGPAPSKDFPNVPYALDLAKTAADRSLLEVAQGPLGVGYAYMLGPSVPQDRAAALRAAFETTLRDPDFLADANKQVLTIAPISAQDIRARLAKAYETPPAILAPIRAAYGK
jgi:tripartite-type tricarboxylate transporter receptor subunit TctC